MAVTIYPDVWPGSPTQPDLHELEKRIAADATLGPLFSIYEGAYWDDATPAVLNTAWTNPPALTVGQQAALTLVIAALATDYTSETLFEAGEGLTAGDFVNIYDDAGTRKVRKANADTATPGERPADGFVLDTVLITGIVRVHFEGQNPLVDGTSLGASDVGKDVFLSTTSGGVATTAPIAADDLVQNVGKIVDVIPGQRATIEFTRGNTFLLEA